MVLTIIKNNDACTSLSAAKNFYAFHFGVQ